MKVQQTFRPKEKESAANLQLRERGYRCGPRAPKNIGRWIYAIEIVYLQKPQSQGRPMKAG